MIPSRTIGACYGGAMLAAQAVAPVAIEDWNPIMETRSPIRRAAYADLYPRYLELYTSTRELAHALAARQKR